MNDDVKCSNNMEELEDRPKSLKIVENNFILRHLPRPKLQFKRFSTPLGSLCVEGKTDDSRLTQRR